MIKIDVMEARSPLSHFLGQVEGGETVVVCRNDQPISELRAIVPPLQPKKRVAGLLNGQLDFDPAVFAPMSDEEVDEFFSGPVFPESKSS